MIKSQVAKISQVKELTRIGYKNVKTRCVHRTQLPFDRQAADPGSESNGLFLPLSLIKPQLDSRSL